MKSIILISVLCLNYLQIFGQFPIGKNINKGESELKKYLLSKGYNLVRVEKVKGDRDTTLKSHHLYYAEEFMVSISINIYDNIEHINFNSKRLKTIEKLLNNFSFQKWTLDETNYNWHDDWRFYSYQKYKIVYKSNRTDLHQFIVKDIDHE